MKCSIALLTVVALTSSLGMNGLAHAKLVFFSVDSAATTLNVKATLAGVFTDPVNVNVSGLVPTQGIVADVHDISGDPSQLSLVNGPAQGVFFSPASLNLTLSMLTISGLHASFGHSGPFVGSGGTANSSVFDLSGSNLMFDAGLVQMAGVFATTTDFLVSPDTFALPAGTIGSVAIGTGPPATYQVTLQIPVNLATDISLAHLVLSGQLVLTSFIPEPHTFALSVLTLVCLIPLFCKRFRQ